MTRSDRDGFLNEAVEHDDGGWIKLTIYHWYRNIGVERFDYWPSRKKYKWQGKVKRFKKHTEFNSLIRDLEASHEQE